MGDMRDEVILHAAGFAKVKPLDKHLVVDTLQHKGMVVGMTGDGVNDAPALAKAQIGIAVHGATDAAKSAGDIVLTRDGLSPIFTAIQISRRIFKRLKSYVIYRICITVQVVFFLACLALIYDLRFKALYIILLALFHDLQIVTIAYDHQVAEQKPETPTVLGLILQSYAMGILMFVQTILLVVQGHLFLSNRFENIDDVIAHNAKVHKTEMAAYQETAVFLQISNSSAILIFSARTLSFFFTTCPAWQLMFSTVLGQVLVNVFLLIPDNGIVECMDPMDMVLVWAYDLCWLLILDIVKMSANKVWDQYKDPNIDSNPAIQHQKRMSRTMGSTVNGSNPGRRASFNKKQGK